MAGHSVRFLEMTALEDQRAQQGVEYLEFLRESSMSAGVYVLRKRREITIQLPLVIGRCAASQIAAALHCAESSSRAF